MSEDSRPTLFRRLKEAQEILQEMIDLDPEQAFYDLPALQERAKANLLNATERKRNSIHEARGIAIENRVKEANERNAPVRAAVLKLMGEGIKSPTKIDQELRQQGLMPPKAQKWTYANLTRIVPELRP